MTPKEKAKELFERFENAAYNYFINTGDGVEIVMLAKQCALIAVDEILNNNNKIPGLLPQDTMHNTWFWQEVKQEI